MSAKASERWLLIFLSVACAVPLLIVAFGSLHSRYIADDYCWMPDAHANPLQFANGMYHNMTGRFVGIALITLVGYFQVPAFPVVSLLILAWLLTTYCVLATVLARLTVRSDSVNGWAVLGSLLIVSSVLLSIPSVQTSLYWHTTTLMYVFPIVTFTAYVGLVLQFGAARWAWGAAFFLTFMTAGSSDTFAPLQIVLIGGVLLIAVWQRSVIRPVLAVSFLGALAGFIVVLIAPGNAVRAAALNSAPSFAFVRYLPYISGQPLVFAVRQAPFIVLATGLLCATFGFY